MTESPHLITEDRKAISVVTFNRPEKLNAMSLQLMAALEDALVRFRDSTQLKVMLIQANGRFFSAGADLKEGGGGTPPTTGSAIRESLRRLPSRMRQVWDEMEAIEKPIVVAHQAACMGAGLEMSLSCDFRLASAGASYALPEAQFGVLAATNGVSRLTRLVGPHWARLLIMANMPVDAQEARMMGLVHKVFPEASCREDVMGFCRHLARQNGEFMGAAKLSIELAADLSAHQAGTVERLANSALMLNPAYQALLDSHLATIGTPLEK
jgi:enoyl-CoA hydratase/carnithine racemase